MANYGLIEVHNGESEDVDIVFLHGLRGDAKATWTKDSVLWPQDVLAKDIPNSRILLYGYDSGIVHRNQSAISQTDLRSDSEDLCAKLAAKRFSTQAKERPIILIAHSLGGLVAAQAVTLGAARPEGDAAHDVASHVRGMMFFGTPFRGSPTAKPAEIVRKILSTLHLNTQESTLKLLGVDSERLTALNYEFPEVLRKRQSSETAEEAIRAFFFYETYKTNGVMVVEPYSAQLPGCGQSAPLRANHVSMCKFASKTDEGYDVALMNIRQMMLLAKNNTKSQNGNRVINNNSSKVLNQAAGDINLRDIRIDNF